MPRSYAPQFRSMVIEQVRSGRSVAEVAASVEVPESTVYRWVRQDRIDRGELAGTSTVETAELHRPVTGGHVTAFHDEHIGASEFDAVRRVGRGGSHEISTRSGPLLTRIHRPLLRSPGW